MVVSKLSRESCLSWLSRNFRMHNYCLKLSHNRVSLWEWTKVPQRAMGPSLSLSVLDSLTIVSKVSHDCLKNVSWLSQKCLMIVSNWNASTGSIAPQFFPKNTLQCSRKWFKFLTLLIPTIDLLRIPNCGFSGVILLPFIEHWEMHNALHRQARPYPIGIPLVPAFSRNNNHYLWSFHQIDCLSNFKIVSWLSHENL